MGTIASLSVGSFEAQSIALALESIEEKRPMTHDLICHLLSEIGFLLKESESLIKRWRFLFSS